MIGSVAFQALGLPLYAGVVLERIFFAYEPRPFSGLFQVGVVLGHEKAGVRVRELTYFMIVPSMGSVLELNNHQNIRE